MKRLFTSILRPAFWFYWDVFFLAYDLTLFAVGVVTGNAFDVVFYGGFAVLMAWGAEVNWRGMRK